MKFYEWYLEESYVYLVHEYCAGEVLFRKVARMKAFTEQFAACIAKQIFSLLNYYYTTFSMSCPMLSPFRIYFMSNDTSSLDIKVPNPQLEAFVQSCLLIPAVSDEMPYYTAPEVLSGESKMPLAGMWSAGVIIYHMITGKVPFDGTNSNAVKANIIRGIYPISKTTFSGKDECRELISSLLVPEKSRLTPELALNHAWMKKFAKGSSATDCNISSSVLKALLNFSQKESLKRAVLGYVATQATAKELEMARKTFVALDKNGDGRLSKEEIAAGFKGLGEESAIMEFLSKADTDKNGYIDYTGIDLVFKN